MNLSEFDHIVVVIEENLSFGTVIGNRDAPYMNYLAQRGALFTNSHFIRRPSQPNYIVLFSGHLHGISDNRVHPKIEAPNLYTALNEVGKTFICYSDDLPYIGYDGIEHKGYVRKHNPSTQFTTVPSLINQPFSYFPEDFNRLPTVSFVIPNQNNNAHDGSLSDADRWLYNNLARYEEWAPDNNSLLIVTFDEPETNIGAVNIPTIFYGSKVYPGEYSNNINHVSIVKFILETYRTEDNLQLGHSVHEIPKFIFKNNSKTVWEKY
jgi:phosphatidylinositol-3-phosphatase